LNQVTSSHGSQTYANIVGAGSGTLILIIAREIPDTYWFKSYLVFAAPSISVCLSNLSNEVRTYLAELRRKIRRILKEKKAMREIKALTRYPHVTPQDIYLLTKEVTNAKIEEVRKIIRSLND
jgi:hypothetical protein